MKRILLLCIMVSLLPSCAHVISRDNRALASRGVAFPDLLQSPDTYVNQVFIFGGIIAGAAVSRDGTEIEVVQSPVDRFGGIIDPDKTGGRFIITTERQLDPLVYRSNRLITFAGRLAGSRKKMLGDREYLYPVFEAREIYLWHDDRYYLYPYYPYPYYWYDPYPYYWYYPYRSRTF